MTKEERMKYYDLATKKWGMEAQIDQCVEELAELIVALNKYKRKTKFNEYQGNNYVEDNILVELADVSICLEQMTNFFDENKVNQKIESQMQKFIKQINS